MNTDVRTGRPVSDDWRTNTTPDEVVRLLLASEHIVLLTHAKPDGDAVGSTLALCRSLLSAGKSAEVWYVEPIPRWVEEIAADTPRRAIPTGARVSPDEVTPDAIVIMDTGTWSQLGEVDEWLRAHIERVIVVDHHLHGDGDTGARKLILTTAAATTEAVAPICVGVSGCGRAAELDAAVADPLYLGLATDTGWFHHSNVRAATLRLAAELMDAGAQPPRLYELVEQRDSASRWRLLGRALSSLELHDRGRISVMTLTKQDFIDAAADRNDTGGFADMVQSIASVRVSAVLTEADTPDGAGPLTKISLRSKSGDDAVDVNEVSRALGGGGHARAAGARVRADLQEAKRMLLEALAAG